jgi:hypothetical protein
MLLLLSSSSRTVYGTIKIQETKKKQEQLISVQLIASRYRKLNRAALRKRIEYPTLMMSRQIPLRSLPACFFESELP